MILRRPRRPGLIPTVNLAVGERPSGSARRFPAGGGRAGTAVRCASRTSLSRGGLARADGFPFAAVLLPIGLSGHRVTKRLRVPKSGVRPISEPGGPLRVGRGPVDRFVRGILARFRCLGEGLSGPAADSGPLGPGGAVASGIWGREPASSAHNRRVFGASKGVMTDDTARSDSPMGSRRRRPSPKRLFSALRANANARRGRGRPSGGRSKRDRRPIGCEDALAGRCPARCGGVAGGCRAAARAGPGGAS